MKILRKTVCCLLAALMALLTFAFTAFASDSGTQSVYSSYIIPAGSVRMTGHRGYSSVAPENTLPAFRLAGEYGFWGAECDICTTSDGVWVIMHDDTVDRMTDGEGKVKDLSFEQIRALTIDAGSNFGDYPDTKVPTLVEYLDVCASYGMHPVIEIKGSADPDALEGLASLLGSREEKDRFVIISFERSFCARMKELLPATPVYLLIGGDTDEAFLGGIDFCVENGLDGIDFACVWSRRMVKKVVKAGLGTMVWTVDDLKTAEKYYRCGVRDVTTNSLTPTEPEGGVFDRMIWRLRDLFYTLFNG